MSAVNGSSGNHYANSVSGLRDASLRIQAVANNIANANTNGFSPDRVDSEAEKTGGVRGLVVEANSAILQDKKAASQTDYATEAANLTLARRAFTANLAAMQAQRAADQATLDTVD